MPKDIELCSERFEKAKIVNGILRRLAETRKVSVRELYEQFGWGLFEGEDGHAYDVLQNAQLDPSLLVKYKVKERFSCFFFTLSFFKCSGACRAARGAAGHCAPQNVEQPRQGGGRDQPDVLWNRRCGCSQSRAAGRPTGRHSGDPHQRHCQGICFSCFVLLCLLMVSV
jgi:hypothetical protein